jgi:hypothetical protein
LLNKTPVPIWYSLCKTLFDNIVKKGGERMVEFNRRSIALLRSIKKLARDEVGADIHFNSPTLEQDLRLVVKSGVSAELLALVEDFLPTQAPAAKPQPMQERRVYRGCELLMDDAERQRETAPKRYRGQLVTA